MSGLGKLALALLIASAVLADTATLRAQSCAMCYNTAAAAKAVAIQALRSGILILLVPVALMFIGIFILVFRSQERSSEFELETGNLKLETCQRTGSPPWPANFDFRNSRS